MRTELMPSSRIQVYIVGNEPSVCMTYARLAYSANMDAAMYSSAEDLMRTSFKAGNACVVFDNQSPSKGGFEFPVLLDKAGHKLPVIYISSNDTAETRNLAQRCGAAAYFRKPVDDQALLDAIHWATSSHAAG